MEFACKVAGSTVIVVLGHTKCGAVKGACDNVQMGHLTGLLAKIGPAVQTVDRDGAEAVDRVESVALENTRQQMRSILERSPILAQLFAEGAIGFACGVYSVETGDVTFVDQLCGGGSMTSAERVSRRTQHDAASGRYREWRPGARRVVSPAIAKYTGIAA
jgi:carbonic anhydrase